MSDMYALVAQLKASAEAINDLPGPQKVVAASEEFSGNYNDLRSSAMALSAGASEVAWPPRAEASNYVDIEAYLSQLVAIIENRDDYEQGMGIY